jgi:hypothetical protein
MVLGKRSLMSKTKEDLNKIVAIEKAIAKKFGPETIVNPKSSWDDIKEKEYLQQLKEFYKNKRKKDEDNEKTEKDGFLLAKNLISKDSKRVCLVCETYSFKIRDDLYMNKYECCWKCYIKWIEDREERWLNGWRPDKEQK